VGCIMATALVVYRSQFAGVLVLALLISGCAQVESDAVPRTESLTDSHAAEAMSAALATTPDSDRLAALWQERRSDNPASDYPLGPGDVLGVSVPAIDELRDRDVRIAGDGTVILPFVGTLRAEGRTEKGIRQELTDRLEKYMSAPEVYVFVKQYRSRQVAVVGAVGKPGLYNLASGDDTILDMLNQAGGLDKEAAPRLLLIPARSVSGTPVEGVRTTEGSSGSMAGDVAEPDRGSARGPDLVSAAAWNGPLPQPTNRKSYGVSSVLSIKDPAAMVKESDPIVIDLASLGKGGQQSYLALPARPGDVLIVPNGGEVLVEGWVQKPGGYKITSGLTASGAIAAAGGTLFAADKDAVRLIRSGKHGERLTIPVDIAGIDKGHASDIPVQEGDVIQVPYSSVKIAPYGLGYLIGKVGVGANIAAF